MSGTVSFDEDDLDTVFSRLSDFDGNRADNINPLLESGMCWREWPDEPWSIRYYFSTRGQDNGHIYFWILKDLSWLQNWYYPGHIFGFLAILWSFFMVVKALCHGFHEDAFIVFCQLIWLTGNFLWMNGELHDEKFPNQPSTYDKRQRQAGYLLMTAFCMISAYYFLWIPAKKFASMMRDSATTAAAEEEAEFCEREKRGSKRKETYEPVRRVYDRISHDLASTMKVPIPYPSMLFASWKHYENVHILMWLGKDTAWNYDWIVMWICFSIPTILIGVDFLHKSLFTRRLMIDHAHYCAQFLWVFSNLVWAYGELFLSEKRDEAIAFWVVDSDATKNPRWYATWILLSAFVPLVCLYVFWTWGTLTGQISVPEEILRKRSRRKDRDLMQPMLRPDSASEVDQS